MPSATACKARSGRQLKVFSPARIRVRRAPLAGCSLIPPVVFLIFFISPYIIAIMGVIRSDSGLSPTQQPNYVNPPTRKPSVQAVGILFGVLVTLSLVLRLYSRGYIKRQFDLDDIFATFATVCPPITLHVSSVFATLVSMTDE